MKDNSWDPRIKKGQHQGPPPPSYRDKVAGSLPGAFEQAFMLEIDYDDDTEDDIGPEEEDGIPSVLLTRQEKRFELLGETH